MKHILSVLVENKPGVLSRVTGMVSRRGFNIDSLSVGPTEDPTMSRITIIVKADELAYEQLTKQLNKLVSVFKITDLTDTSAIERELVLFKVNAAPDRRNEIIEIANVFRAKIVDVGRSSLTSRPRATSRSSRAWRTCSAHTASRRSHAPARSPCRVPPRNRRRHGFPQYAVAAQAAHVGDAVIGEVPCSDVRRNVARAMSCANRRGSNAACGRCALQPPATR